MCPSADLVSKRRNPASVRWQGAAAISLVLLFGGLSLSAEAASAAGARSVAAAPRDLSVPTTEAPGDSGNPLGVSPAPSASASIRPVGKGSGANYRPVTRVTSSSSTGSPTRTERSALVGLALAVPLGTWLVMAASDRWRRRRR
ncbi:MAG TPA: hypothetical protein VNF71_08840 [Acidimicrobiales bacterium]|nr:hypothetical protein [Acidimicrobiales bacterium]